MILLWYRDFYLWDQQITTFSSEISKNARLRLKPALLGSDKANEFPRFTTFTSIIIALLPLRYTMYYTYHKAERKAINQRQS